MDSQPAAKAKSPQVTPLFTRLWRPLKGGEGEMRRHVLWWILLRLMLFTLLFIIASFFRGKSQAAIVPPLAQTLLFLFILYTYSIGSTALLPQIVPSWLSLRIFSLAQLCSDAFCVAVFIYATGCSHSVFTPLFILPVFAAGLILFKTGALLLAAMSTLCYGAVLVLEFMGILPGYIYTTAYTAPDSVYTSTNLFSFYGLLFFLAALLSGQLGSRLHRTEEALNQATRAYDRLYLLYKQIFDDLSTGIITIDGQDRISSYNQAAAAITGYGRDQVIGKPFALYFSALSPRPHQGRDACDFMRADGESIRIGYAFSALHLPNAEGKSLSDAGAKVITLQDISQVERMERQMREAEKLAAIGEMSALVAHDFRNPLAAISGSAELLRLELTDMPEANLATARSLIGIIMRESERMAKTITDFLHFARPRPPILSEVSLASFFDKQIQRFRRENERFAHMPIEHQAAPDLVCQADEEQLAQVLLQLLENACDANEQGSSLLVRAHRSQDAQAIILEVCDQGSGIPEALRQQVFAPFFSRRPNGAGLGLAIVRQIIQQHHGQVRMESDEHYACIARITLPVQTMSMIPPPR